MQFLVKKNDKSKKHDLVGYFSATNLSSLLNQVTNAREEPDHCLYLPVHDIHISLNGRIRSNGKVFIAQSFFCENLVKMARASDKWVTLSIVVEQVLKESE